MGKNPFNTQALLINDKFFQSHKIDFNVKHPFVTDAEICLHLCTSLSLILCICLF